MAKKKRALPDDVLKVTPGQQEAIKRVISRMISQPEEELEEIRILTDQEWRAWMDRIEARLARLEEELAKRV